MQWVRLNHEGASVFECLELRKGVLLSWKDSLDIMKQMNYFTVFMTLEAAAFAPRSPQMVFVSDVSTICGLWKPLERSVSQ